MTNMKTVSAERHIYAFAPDMAPAGAIMCGELVRFEAHDALGGQIRSESDVLAGLDFNRVNPATGPLEIKGARRGDTLVVSVKELELADRGVTVTGPGLGVLPGLLGEHVTRILPVRSEGVRFNDIWLPYRPMIGVIGVAPEKDGYPTGTAHRHGGNMDTKEIGIGSILYLPVFQDGAMLAMGDVHAVMGDGEVCVSACEVAAKITVAVDRIPGRCREWPIVETSSSWHILVSLPTIEEALAEATHQAVRILEEALELATEDAYMLTSLAVDLGISQLVDPNKTAKASIPKTILPSAF
jgi:amidase